MPEGLPFRETTFVEWAHVPSEVKREGKSEGLPTVTIAIPTFRRFDLLVDAVQSALDLQFDRPVEIVVVDNDPDSRDADRLVERYPQLLDRPFRYFVNKENIGIFPNHNRCIELARAEWMTILNDDDLLDPDFLQRMFAALGEAQGADGIVSRKRYRRMGQRPPSSASLRLRRCIGKAVRAPLYLWHFGLSPTRRLYARNFFWGPVAGTPLGFFFRKTSAQAVGGFDTEDFPAADLWFYARFASRCHLRQHRDRLATARILENESAKPETVIRSLQSVHRLQQALAVSEAPRRWLRFAPLVLARLRTSAERTWRSVVPYGELDRQVGVHLGEDRPVRLAAIRLSRGGWFPDAA